MTVCGIWRKTLSPRLAPKLMQFGKMQTQFVNFSRKFFDLQDWHVPPSQQLFNNSKALLESLCLSSLKHRVPFPLTCRQVPVGFLAVVNPLLTQRGQQRPPLRVRGHVPHL